MSQTLLQSVNRVLRMGGIIRGDTDPVLSFSDIQHSATLNLAIIAIQSVLTDISAYYDLPMERNQGSITLVTGQRIYPLATDFIQFWNDDAFFYDSFQNYLIREFNGGEKRLSQVIYDYKTQSGYPNQFYYVDAATKQVGFFQVPSADLNGRVIVYDYEKDIIPLVETDNMPFIRDVEVFKFCELALVKFNSLFTQQPRLPGTNIEGDPVYISSRADLLRLMNPVKPRKRYGQSVR